MGNHRTFVSDETGAVTVDWVVLTAAIVGIAIAVILVVSPGVNSKVNGISDYMEQDNIVRIAFASADTSALSDTLAESLRNTANGLSNVDLAAEYARQLANGAAAAATNLANQPGSVDEHDFTTSTYDYGGVSYGDAASANAAINADRATVQEAGIYADEATQRGLNTYVADSDGNGTPAFQ